ncbi:MAG: hypothetical protein Q8L60_10570 [Gammaproteobacteria bacterium]|nr:hypothetical protein [Gammaproteobacteria bacterium]MDP2346791.1 hypothetical protein [Gammaproteobacteria bacterium]
MIRFEQFLAELKAEHDICGYDFVAIKAWNAAIECAIASCEIIAKKCCDNDHPYGEGAAEDCADAIRGNLIKAAK